MKTCLECDLYGECECDLCITYAFCETRKRCVTYDNRIMRIENCDHYTDWLTKITNPKLYKASLEHIEERKKLYLLNFRVENECL